jgi:23S rRNA pseudouridine955/2504/2580 synthase
VSDEAGEKTQVRLLTVGPDKAGQRIDNFLHTELKGAPKSLIYRILRKGEVRINKGRAKPDQRIAVGDVVRIPPIRLGEQAPPLRVGDALKRTLQEAILYEDEQLLILDKPYGLAVHAGSGVQVGLIEALRVARPDETGLELAHRLDRETSGVIVLAKGRAMLLRLHEILREESAHKVYRALVHGRWPDKVHEVDAPLEKNTLRGGERLVEVNSEGKASRTRFHVVARFHRTTLIEAMPLTGRTHQIRVHCLHQGHPICGDEKYGDADRDQPLRTLGLKRLFLHAARIELPFGKRTLTVRAPLPAELEAVLQALKRTNHNE